MRRLLLSTGAAALLAIAVVATVAAAGPMGRAGGASATERAGGQSGVVADILGLTQDAIEDLRHDGLSLAQIAEKQNVDPQKLVDALTTQLTTRIDARAQRGALTADQATALKTQLAARVTTMVNQTSHVGMQGVAVGAGPANAPGYRGGAEGAADPGTRMGGRGAGNGTCDGTGTQPTQP
ncbi:MAG: hypothetical protein ABIG85_00505 [Chloroflexota bacterium]